MSRIVDPKRVWRLDELPEPPRRVELVEGLIAQGELIALSGEPGAGKTAVAVELVRAVSRGEDFFGRRCKAGDVLYIACEKKDETCRRLLAANVDAERTHVRLSAIRLDQESDVSEGVEIVADLKPALIVVDTLARSFGSRDENSNRDVGLCMSEIDRLQAASPRTAIVLLHHVAKSVDVLRGGSAILAAVDVDLRTKSERKGKRFLVVAKANAVADGQRLEFELATKQHSDGLPVVLARPLVAVECPPSKGLRPSHTKILEHLPIGQTERSEVFASAAKAGLLGPSENKYRDILRRALVALKAAGELDYDTATITRFEVSPNAPNDTQFTPNCSPKVGAADQPSDPPNDVLPLRGTVVAWGSTPVVGCRHD